MKKKAKMLLRWLGAFILCFLAIYLIVFLGGWKLFESGDPILMEIGAALVLSIFFFCNQRSANNARKEDKRFGRAYKEARGYHSQEITDKFQFEN